MDLYLVVLRIIHITSGVLWLGGAFFITLFVEPATKAAGPEGGKFMERLTATRFPQVLTLAAALAILSGIFLYWRDSAGFQLAWMRTPTGLAFATGGLAALAAFGIGVFVVRPKLVRLGAFGKELAPPVRRRLHHNSGSSRAPGERGATLSAQRLHHACHSHRDVGGALSVNEQPYHRRRVLHSFEPVHASQV